MIINGELQNGLGGGICQVSTTVFNAAFDAGLPITARTNHALYITHYPLGRDATVNYPDLDLKFVERHRRTGCSCGRSSAPARSPSISTARPSNRRVESTTAPLAMTGPVPVKETDDPTLAKGKRVVDEFGSPPRQTSVAAPRVRREREAALRQHVALVLRRRAVARAGRHQGAAEEAGQAEEAGDRRSDDAASTDPARRRPADRHGSDGHDSRSAVAIASTNHGGTRVGCRVAASTVAWSVSAVATSSPSRSIRYS